MAMPPKPWPTGETEQVEPLVRRVLAPNGSPFTYTGTQTYLVGGMEGLAVIDPGPADEAHLDALERAIGDAPVTAILCTHTHRDHSPASRPLAARTGAPIIGCAPLVLETHGPRADVPFDQDYEPDRIMDDGDKVDGPGWTLTAVATPGHTTNHLSWRRPMATWPTTWRASRNCRRARTAFTIRRTARRSATPGSSCAG